MDHVIRPVLGHEELGECVICDAAEGELPGDCPGRTMTRQEREDVLYGILDHRNGVWIEVP